MKGFALILLCVAVAVQGRSTGVQTVASNKAVAALGENPWLVHLRLAVATSGFLNSCAGSLISQSWVLTTGSCVENARFIWVRYGAVNVVNPSLVTETSVVRVFPDWAPGRVETDVALVSINRVVQFNENIAPVSLASSLDLPETANFCGFGALEDGPGEVLSCFDVTLSGAGEISFVAQSEDGQTTQFDNGAPLVSDGVQIGILVSGESGTFISPAVFRDWIQIIIGETLSA
ncbi:chymotrypsin BII-like [Pectinophora gossypiella]|uniref:chymotrypsin BII-like n=1 Tax=Pectinophora gossypiella TaxID=13191 RepID=UPI00214E5345|nr:chymotrypsin BII-like [Pectinophora gossypiella]